MPISTGPGSPQVVSSASGGKVYGYNNINETTAHVVAQPNPSRAQITFCNPGANDMYIAPVNVQNTLGTAPTTPTSTPLTPTNSALGGCWPLFGNGGILVFTGECQGAYQALAKTGAGTTNPLTVNDSNI